MKPRFSEQSTQQFTFMLYMMATRPHGQAQHKQEKMDQAIQVVGGGGGWAAEMGWVVTTCKWEKESSKLKECRRNW